MKQNSRPKPTGAPKGESRNPQKRNDSTKFAKTSHEEFEDATPKPSRKTKTTYSGPRIGKSRIVLKEASKHAKFEDKKPVGTKGKVLTAKKMVEPEAKSGPIRLNKYIANSGVCSRREADTYITAGVVKVNGKIITELGFKVAPYDKVEFEGQIIKNESKVYIVLNKPKDVISAVTDERGQRTVIDIVKNACPQRLYPVGRLDKATTGVLLLTNDGDLTKKLTHPKSNIKKIYQVGLDKDLTKFDMEKLVKGLILEDGEIHADEVSYIDMDDKKKIGIEMHSGRNRIVRRMFEHLGYNVKKLDRVYFAGITKKMVVRGRWRYLSEQEVNFLKML